jgi:glycosyltransferase involved in cell wall biosynthesis
VPEASLFGSLSVVIPTYNRETVLAKALGGYLAQSSPQLVHELLVVDDGSTDGTESMVREFTKRSLFPIRYLQQPNKGPAAARNLGIREARSALVLFSDSDIVPERNLVEQHIECHRRNSQTPAAVLGYVTWSPEIEVTPFMRWYGDNKLFNFNRLQNNQEAPFQFFYTCNLSLKTEFLRTCGQFDEEFKSAAFEDIELGYRLSKHGLQLFYNSAAIGYHHQFFSFEDACRKCLDNVAAGQMFLRKEAGQQYSKQTQTARLRYGSALRSALAGGLSGVLSPPRRLLDSSIPLPGIVYRLFFRDCTRQLLKQRTATVGHNEDRHSVLS